jgi:lambda family phage portal protein
MALFDLFKRRPAAPVAHKRAYTGASFGKQMRDWVAASTNQDAETRMALRALRNRSRDLARNNDYVVNALRIVQNNVIGQGVKMQAQASFSSSGRKANTSNKAANEAIETARNRWKRADNCHVAGQLTYEEITRLVILSVARDGEAIIRLVPQKFGTSPVPLALEVIEADHLDEEMNGRARNGNEIRMGVEIDMWGRPVAYHLFQRHPGDYQRGDRDRMPRIRVPASEIIHLFRQDRAGQTRGLPWIASSVESMRHMTGVVQAEVIAARAAACQMGFIETPEGQYEADDTDDDGSANLSFEPGTIRSLGAGEKFVSHAPARPAGLLEPFMRFMLRGVAAGFGVSYSSLGLDYGQANYSSSRLELLNERDNWRAIQAWFISAFEQRVYEAWLQASVLSGVLNLPFYEVRPELYDTPKWVARGWSWVDPAKEVRAYKEAVRCGFMTQSEVIMYAGGEFDEFVVARQREIEANADAGLVFDTDPAQVTGSGQAQVDPDANVDSAEEIDTTEEPSSDQMAAADKKATQDA